MTDVLTLPFTMWKPIFNFNLRRSRGLWICLVLLLSISTMAVSCDTTWLTAVLGIASNFIPIAGQIVTLIGLIKGGIDTATAVKIQGVLTDAQKDINLLKTLAGNLASLGAGDPTKPAILNQINNLISTVYTNLADILPALHVYDQATQDKIKTAIGLLLASIQDIVQQIPGAIAPASSPVLTARANPMATDAIHMARQIHIGKANRNAAAAPLKIRSGKDLKAAWNVLMSTSSGDSNLDVVSKGLVLK